MTWLYIPSTVYPFVPESAASSLASPGLLAERIEQCVSWRGMSIRPQRWLRECGTVQFARLLSGLMLKPSIQSLGMASWISSLRATRVSRSVLQENDKEKRTHDICGHTSLGTSVGCDLDTCFVKTSHRISVLGSIKSAQTYEQWVTALRQESSQRLRSAQGTYVNASSLWPTPVASDVNMTHHPLHYWVGRNRIKRPSGQIFNVMLSAAVMREESCKMGVPRLPGGVNPVWTEWLMGFPSNWTAIEPLAMQSFRKWLSTPGKSSLPPYISHETTHLPTHLQAMPPDEAHRRI